MKFIAEIIFIALLGTVVCSQDSDDRATLVRTANANSVHQQSDSNAHSSAFGIQRSFEKRQPFQITNSQQKDVTNYTVKRPSLVYTPPKINSSTSRQALPMPYSTPRPSRQQSSYVPQNLSGSTFYNPQSNQLSYSDSLPLNCSELSPTCLTLQSLLSSLTNPRPLYSAFRTGKDNSNGSAALGAFQGENIMNAEQIFKGVLNGSKADNVSIKLLGQLGQDIERQRRSRLLRSSRLLGSSGLSGSSRSSEPFEAITERPFSPFTTPSEISLGAISNVATAEESTRNPETETNVSNTHTGVHQSDSNLSAFGIQRSLEKRRPFQATNAQQKDVTNTVKRQSSIYNPLSSSASRQILSTPYSTPRPNSQQSSSIYAPQNFNGSTSYNPQSKQLSYTVSLPLNCSESSSTCLSPQPLLFSLSNLRPFHSFKTDKQFGGHGSGNEDILETAIVDFGIEITGDTIINPAITITAADRTTELSGPPGFLFSRPLRLLEPTGIPDFSGPLGPLRPSEPFKPLRTSTTRPSIPGPSRPLIPSRPSEPLGPTPTTTTPFYPFTIPSEIGAGPGVDIATIGKGPGIPGTGTGIGVSTTGPGETTPFYDGLNHPPHIHNLDVECSKTMMTINIEFNRAFDGVIYSKGYYMNPECTYVKQNSGSTRYSFTVNLDSCGTQFINDFQGAGQAYLENVLVLQNEPGIQEVWDTVRRVRCLWEGNINTALTVNLLVDMLNQEIVTFNGDTAITKLDIQIGRGPFAPTADGLVKIGETMTLVVSVEGDPDFDLQVRDCSARDDISTNVLQLTDERGCILKPKLFGSFQKTTDTGNTGASIIAYAFFQAFKFPDVMDLFIECNVELCKTNCEPCPEANQQIEPGRRRRSVTHASSFNNSTKSILLADPVRVRRHFKVTMLDDLSAASSQILYGRNGWRSDNEVERGL